MKRLTKTEFILYRECRNNVWVKIHRADEYSKFEVSEFEQSLAEMGNDVEALARGMFPEGYLVERRSPGAQELTKKLISEHHPVIFQAVFATEKFLAAADVLQWNTETELYDLYEIKMSATQEEEEDEDGKPKRVDKKKELQYEYDLSFQTNVIETCGVRLGKKYLVRLNRKYVRHGDLDFTPGTLFIVENKTDAVARLAPIAAAEMNGAYLYLMSADMPAGPCPCYYRGRSSHCTAFTYINPHVPAYSVHDLNRIGNSPRYLKELLDEGVLHMKDVPIDDRLRPKESRDPSKPSRPRKLNQVMVHKTNEPMADIESLKAELDSLKFPLYFLDYETYPTAIPPFNGYRPYQQIVFQYSLHVLKDPHSEPLHFEELILNGDPAERIAKSLKEKIGGIGTVISWYKKFENDRNRELAKFLPEYTDFFNALIARTYDLMNLVEDQHYVHPKFEGRSTIKKVLPALAPQLTYKALEGVQSGTDAIEAYRQIVSGEVTSDSLVKKRHQMLEYCKLDTYAMYILWKFFKELVEASQTTRPAPEVAAA